MNTYKSNPIKVDLAVDEQKYQNVLCNSLKIKVSDISNVRVYKKSIDARNKTKICFVVTFIFDTDLVIKNLTEFKLQTNLIEEVATINNDTRPVVVGSGPAGLFCALYLAKANCKPIIIERGQRVDKRKKSVEEFWSKGILNINSNVQYGEGGAGTFSDGKLTTGINDSLLFTVFDEFKKNGAPAEIMYSSTPHIGTDNLVKIVKNIRNKIIDLGGEFCFDTQMTDIEIVDNAVKNITIKNNDEFKKINVKDLVLALGHSARDTFEMLNNNGVKMEQKDFSMGVRIEHNREFINKSQFGNAYINLPTADYKLVEHLADRSVYTFCMCPGGVVVPSASEENSIVTNGMSFFARNAENSNAGVLVEVKKSDFNSTNPLEGVYFQQKYERLAYNSIQPYFAPCQNVSDFLLDKKSTNFVINPSYLVGVYSANLKDILPPFVNAALKEALPKMDKKIKGFIDNGIITGIETRSSSPLRILREEYMSNIVGIYPCGEGSGYSGGIVSSAVDGIKCARAVIKNNM